MKVKSIAEFCNTFDLHQAIIGIENKFPVFLRVAVLDRFTVKLLPTLIQIAHMPAVKSV